MSDPEQSKVASQYAQTLPTGLRDLINGNRDILNYVLSGELQTEGPYSFTKLKINFEGRGDAIRSLETEGFIKRSEDGKNVILNFAGFIFCDSLEASGLHELARRIYTSLRETYKRTEGREEVSLQTVIKMVYKPPFDLPDRIQAVSKILDYLNTAPFYIVSLKKSPMYDNPTSNIPIVSGGDQIIDYENLGAVISKSCKVFSKNYIDRRHGQSSPTEDVQVKTEGSNNGLIFIACGQLEDREKALGIKIKDYFERKKIPAFFAETENDLESLNTHIFQNLNKCTGFIGILHKRTGKHETSVWINQEVAIAAFINSAQRKLPALILYENGTEEAGLIKYTIANPLRFSSDEEVLEHIYKWIANKDLGSKPLDFDVIINEDRKQLGSTGGGGSYHSIQYVLSFRVRNRSNINVCLEDVEIKNDVLGMGILDKHNPSISRLPANIDPRKTEELNLLFKFPNGVDGYIKGKDLKLQVAFKFSDMVIDKEIIRYL